jgi:hypothetical protein
MGAQKIEFITFCRFATNVLDEVHEQGAKAAVRLDRHGHEGIAGILPRMTEMYPRSGRPRVHTRCHHGRLRGQCSGYLWMC